MSQAKFLLLNIVEFVRNQFKQQRIQHHLFYMKLILQKEYKKQQQNICIIRLITFITILHKSQHIKKQKMSRLSMLIFIILTIMLVAQIEGRYGKQQHWKQNKPKNYGRQKYQNYRQGYGKYGKQYRGKGYNTQQVVSKKQITKKAATKPALKQIAPAKPSKTTKTEKKSKSEQKAEVIKEQPKIVIEQKIIMPIAQIPPQIQNELKQIRRLIQEKNKAEEEEKAQKEQKQQKIQVIVQKEEINVQKKEETAVIVVPIPAPEPICEQKPVYDYNLLVLTWVPEECYSNIDCEKDWQTEQDLRSPTIHSFRPYGSSSYYESCFIDKGDPSCQFNAYKMDFDIDEALWNVTGLIYQISEYWPALKFTHDQDSFYNKQWVQHGSCYLMNMIEDNPNAYKYDKAAFNRTIMVEYFRTAINKFKQLAIDVEPGTQYLQKEDFADEIGFRGKETHFMLLCNKKNQIVEITFCFNRSKLPGKEVTIPCTMDDSCDEMKPLVLKKPFMIQI